MRITMYTLLSVQGRHRKLPAGTVASTVKLKMGNGSSFQMNWNQSLKLLDVMVKHLRDEDQR